MSAVCDVRCVTSQFEVGLNPPLKATLSNYNCIKLNKQIIRQLPGQETENQECLQWFACKLRQNVMQQSFYKNKKSWNTCHHLCFCLCIKM